MPIEVITREEFEPVVLKLEQALKELAELKRQQKQWLSTNDAMEQFCISRTTLENLRRDGTIECKKEGTKPLYSRDSLIAHRERKPGKMRVNRAEAA